MIIDGFTITGLVIVTAMVGILYILGWYEHHRGHN